MRLPTPPTPVCIVLIIAGVVVLLATSIAFLQLSGRFQADAHRVTVPDAVELTVEPDTPIFILRELAGSHVTANRPLVDLPDDLTIAVTDAATGEPIETEATNWWSRQRVIGLERHRRAIVAFRSPDHGRVRIDVRGGFVHDQIFAISPSFHTFTDRWVVPMSTASGVGGLLVVIGLIGCVIRVASAPGPGPGLGDQL